MQQIPPCFLVSHEQIYKIYSNRQIYEDVYVESQLLLSLQPLLNP
ncbi:hypothetical protein MicvaDRAFT_2894 [Microcoleus vaginatus FGP-2]|nr:hypothetical protein MicvaDRAFT_2894 [Microcoleus vaginatus FGP-2]